MAMTSLAINIKNIIADIFFPFLLAISAFTAGVTVSSLKFSFSTGWSMVFLYLVCAAIYLLELRDAGVKNGLFTKYYPQKGDIKISLWPNWLIVIFLLMSVVIFAIGFYWLQIKYITNCFN